MTSRERGFVARLCLALLHRIEPERLFVILTAYFDESGTHADSPVTVMGGVMASVKQWNAFEAEFRRAKKEHGFEIFHTKKLKNRSGDFEGWSIQQQIALIDDLATFANDESFTHSAVLILDDADYEAQYKGGDTPRRVRLDSKYGLCFRDCLIHLLMEARKRRFRKKLPEVHVVLEGGHKNAGDAKRIFHEMKAYLKDSSLDMLKTITFAEKDESDPLMIADFMAHVNYDREIRKRDGRPIRPYKEPQSPGRVTILRHKPGGLKWIKEATINDAPAIRRALASSKGRFS